MTAFDKNSVIEFLTKQFKATKTDYREMNPDGSAFTVHFIRSDGTEHRAVINLSPVKMELTLDASSCDPATLDKWMKNLEFDLEQEFIKDIRISWDTVDNNYQISIAH